MTLYNPLDKFYKSVTGAVRSDKEITFRVKGNFDSVVFVYEKDGVALTENVQMDKRNGYFECRITFPRGLYTYRFAIGENLYIGAGKELKGVVTDTPESYYITSFSPEYTVPEWLCGGIIYQIFPDRFYCKNKNKRIPQGKIYHEDKSDVPIFTPTPEGKVLNNDFFGGDIAGIIEKLPYIYSLGVTAIYLNPVFEAYSNHRYDTGDYMKIDSLLGTEEDFKELIEKADSYGIKIILDGVFNHTGDDSVYFDKYGTYGNHGAYGDANSPYRSWYKFIKYPTEYESWWGITTLPATNKEDSGYIDFITGKNGVLSRYTKLGIGGWRLDVVDELPALFVQKIRTAVKNENENAIIIGEVWEEATTKISYGVRREYFLGEELDSVMNYPLKNAIISFVKQGNSEKIADCVREQLDRYPSFVLNSVMNILGTHDTARILSAVGDFNSDGKTKEELSRVRYDGTEYEHARNRVKAAALLNYTLAGVPCVYYGDEIGMQGFTDPLNRRYFEWDNLDEELLSFFRRLGKLRKTVSALKDGELKILYSYNGAFVFNRKDEYSEILVAANFGEREKYIRFDGKLKNALTDEVLENEIILKNGEFGAYFAI